MAASRALPLYELPSVLPPLAIQVGTDELLLDDATCYAEAAAYKGGMVQLDVFRGSASRVPASDYRFGERPHGSGFGRGVNFPSLTCDLRYSCLRPGLQDDSRNLASPRTGR
jgi:hypothetical protein